MHGGKELEPPDETKFDKERVKGAINEIAGRAKRQVGEWTGDKGAQVEGMAQEMKGKAQQAWCGDRLLAEGDIRIGCVERATMKPHRIPGPIFEAIE